MARVMKQETTSQSIATTLQYNYHPGAATQPQSNKSFALLASTPLFEELDSHQVAKLAISTYQLSVKMGQILFNQGDPVDGFYIVGEGRVKLSFISKEGKEYITEILEPKQSFGESAMFLNRPFPVCVQALADTRVFHIPKKIIFDCIENYHSFVRKMIAGLCTQLSDQLHALEYLTVHSSIQRVIGYLLSEIDFAKPEQIEAKIILPVNKATLAAQLNLTPETLSRSLYRLANEKLITVEGASIHILQIKKLRNYLGE